MSYNTRSARNGLLLVRSYNTVRFGRKSIMHRFNHSYMEFYLQDKLNEYNFLCLTPRSLKILLVKFFFSEYTILCDTYIYIYIYIYIIYIYIKYIYYIYIIYIHIEYIYIHTRTYIHICNI